MQSKKKKVALVLSGGAARGLCHVGVLKVLEEARIPIDMVVGTSMGGMIGAFFASGINVSTQERLIQYVNRRHWIDFTFPQRGLISGNKLEKLVWFLTKKANFASLQKELAVVATDLNSGRKVVLNQGSVARAVRATTAVPGIFYPVEFQGRLLVDGGVVERVPVKTARELGAEKVIAVDVGTYLDGGNFNHIFDIVTQCLDIMTLELTRTALSHADVVISPSLRDILPAHFHKAGKAIRAGEIAARAKLQQIKNLFREEG